MTYNTFYLDDVMPPTECPDKTHLCDFGGIQLKLRVIKTGNVFGVVIDNVYLSLVGGKTIFARGDYCLIHDNNGHNSFCH